MAETLSKQDLESINPLESMPESEHLPANVQVREILEQVVKAKEKAQLQLEEQQKLTQLRLLFNNSLAKLADASTKEVGMEELQAIIRENATSQALRIYLGLLAEGSKHGNPTGKELYVLLLGYIARVYKQQLIDPIDKPSTVGKTVIRMCTIVRKYLPVTM